MSETDQHKPNRSRKLRNSSIAALLLLASCGDGGSDSGTVVVVPGDKPSPVAMETPAPTPTPSPTSTPRIALEPYVIGALTWSFAGDVPEQVRGEIADAMDWAINMTNTLADYRGNVLVEYDPRVPTAEAGFQYVIRFGGFRDRVTALHELAHWLGSGAIDAWPRNVAQGRFTGLITNIRLQAYDGAGAIMFADWAHFWPYGFDGGDPFREPQRNVMLVSAQRADMGLSDGAFHVTGERNLVNRSSAMMLGGAGGAGGPPRGIAPDTGGAMAWRVGYVDGYVVLENVASGLFVDSMGEAGDGAAVALMSRTDRPRQQWEMIPTDSGWFLLRNRETGRCLDNVNQLSAGSEIRVWSCGGHPNQQWHFMR